jgi:hypothetical protein
MILHVFSTGGGGIGRSPVSQERGKVLLVSYPEFDPFDIDYATR